MKNYLMVDFGSTYTKLTAVDLEKRISSQLLAIILLYQLILLKGITKLY